MYLLPTMKGSCFCIVDPCTGISKIGPKKVDFKKSTLPPPIISFILSFIPEDGHRWV